MKVLIFRKQLVALLVHPVLIIACVLTLLPFIWMILTSIKPPTELFTPEVQVFPKHPTIQHYTSLLFGARFSRWFINSLIIAIFCGLISVIVSSLAAYTITRFKFPARKAITTSFLLGQVFPPAVLVTQIFIVMFRLRLVNTYLSVVLAHSVFSIPFCVWMLISYFKSIPIEIEEAALCDGCNKVQTIWHVVVPVALPGVVTSFLFAFVFSWQEYILALTLTTETSMRTVPVGISLMYGQYSIIWGQIMAGSVLVTLPVMLLFLVIQRGIIGGLTFGSVK